MTVPSSFRRRVGRVRSDLAEALAWVDTRELPQDSLTALGDAHHALTEAIARLEQHERAEAAEMRREAGNA